MNPPLTRTAIGAQFALLSLRGRLALALVGLAALGLIAQLARSASASGSGDAGGMLIITLGLVAVVAYGVSRGSATAVFIWLGACIIVPVAPTSVPLDQLALAAVFAVWLVEISSGQRPFPHLGAIEFLMAAFTVLSLLSVAVPHTLGAVTQLGDPIPLLPVVATGTIYPFAAFVLARHVLAGEREIRILLRALVVLGLYIGLTSIAWIAGMTQLVFPAAIIDEGIGVNADRGRGIFLNPAPTGFVLAACFAATMYLASRHRDWRRPALFGAGVIMLIGSGLTQTRSAWIAAALVIIFCAITFRGFRRWFVVILLAIGLIIASNWSTFTSDDRTQGGVTSVNEADDRLNAAATALWGLEREPLFGWGLGRFEALNTVHHQSWGMTPWERGYGIIAHDTQLGIAAELGLVGLGLWLALLVALALAGWRAWRILPAEGLVSRQLVLVFWASGLAWLATASLIDMRLFAFPNALLFVLAGVVVGAADQLAPRPSARHGALGRLAPPPPARPGSGARASQP